MSITSVSGSRSSSISQQASSFHYYQDAVRIFVQKMGEAVGDESSSGSASDPMTTSTSSINSGWSSGRRFSVDPQLTTFDILRNLVGRAFDMKGDFAISYRAYDDLGAETYLPLVSDWDLSAAFLSASDPDLQLVIEPKTLVPKDSNNLDVDEDEPWDVVRSTEVMNVLRDASQNPNIVGHSSSSGYNPMSSLSSSTSSSANNYGQVAQNHGFSNNHQTAYHRQNSGSSQPGFPSSSKVLSAMSSLGGAVNQYPISLNSKINTAGIFNTMEKWVQKAKTFVEDLSVVTTRPPLSDVEFRNYLDPGGVLCRPRELRYACYHGGIEPGLRKVVWKHLLNIYPDGLSGNARMEYVRNKSKEYFELRDIWKVALEEGHINPDIDCVTNMVRKDVLRTDRHLQFFAGHDDNLNIGLLFNILTTFALNHPSVGYCQGMSDLASPLLVTMGDEAQAYICFCALMERLKPNFNYDGLAISLKFTHLAETIAFYDPELWSYLKSISADDLLFCYRWLLLELKREFAFDDAARMMEVLWASLPYKPQDVPLFEVKFTLGNPNGITIPVPKNSLASSYSRVCALRRSSSSLGGPQLNSLGLASTAELRGRRFSRKPKASPLSLDENSLSSMSSISSSLMGGSIEERQRSHRKPFYSMDETMEGLSGSDFVSSTESASPFDLIRDSLEIQKPKKLVKNLKEFWAISNPGSVGTMIGKGLGELSPDSTPCSSKSSTVSNFEGVNESDGQETVFFDDPIPGSLDSMRRSTHSLGSQRQFEGPAPKSKSKSRSRHSSAGAGGKCSPLSTSNSTTIPQNSPNFSEATPTLTNLNLTKLEKSEKLNSDNNSGPRPTSDFLSPPLAPDAEGTSQTSNDSNDSGHCFEDSMELFLTETEPEFSGGRVNVAAASAAAIAKVKVNMPSPESLGGGNPFLIFLALTLLLQHRDHIMSGLDYNETAMYFDKLIRKHNVGRVLAHARMLYAEYLKQNAARA